MKKILISIRPQWVAKILNREKTIEVRKTAPKCELPCEVYIYCTNGREVIKSIDGNYKKIKSYTIKKGCVCAKFTLNKVEEIEVDTYRTNDSYQFGHDYSTKTLTESELLEKSCLSGLDGYLGGCNGYAWHIDNLVIFDKPKELGDFVDSDTPTYEQAKPFLELFGRPYYKDSYKESCERLGYTLKRPPQSWQYVEEI